MHVQALRVSDEAQVVKLIWHTKVAIQSYFIRSDHDIDQQKFKKSMSGDDRRIRTCAPEGNRFLVYRIRPLCQVALALSIV